MEKRRVIARVAPIAADANPGDILVPDGRYLIPDGIADEFIPARDLGLLDLEAIPPDPQDDNLDALDAELSVIQPIAPLPGIDQALEQGAEGEARDGDGDA